jgi:hypothetical protein
VARQTSAALETRLAAARPTLFSRWPHLAHRNHEAPAAFPEPMCVLDATVPRVPRGSGKVIATQHRVDMITALKAMTNGPARHERARRRPWVAAIARPPPR